MTPSEIRSLLGDNPVFSAAYPGTLEQLAAWARCVKVKAGDFAFREGDPAPYLFVVADGTFEVMKRAEDGAEVPMRALVRGEVGGLTKLAGPGPRSASLRAREDAAIVAIDKAPFIEAMRGDAMLTDSVLGALGDKVRAKNAQVATLLERTQRDPREKIAFFDAKPYDREAFERRLPDSLRVQWIRARLGPQTARLAEGYPVVCAFVNDDLSRGVLEELAARGVRLVALRCAGYNNVDLAAAQTVGIRVVRVPAYSPHAVAEHTVALLLTLARKTHRAFARVREGNFSLAGLVGFELCGRTAGVIGTGRIGAVVAKVLRGFGMEVVAFDKTPSDELRAAGVRYVALDELFATSDVISLHVPLTKETHHLVDGARLAATKRGVVILNTSRGALVDASALVGALKSGHIGAAGLDVYEEESEYFFQDRSDRAVDDDLLARLMTFPNVLITSHQAFLTHEALDHIAEATLASIGEYFDGKALTRAVTDGSAKSGS
jgi:D-lactate dehydrogenase